MFSLKPIIVCWICILATCQSFTQLSEEEYTFSQNNGTTLVSARLSTNDQIRWVTVSNGLAMVHMVCMKPENDQFRRLTIQHCRLNDNVREAVNFVEEIGEKIQSAAHHRSRDQVESYDYQFFYSQCLDHLKTIDSDDTSGSKVKSRSKRSYMIFPGTNWCGRGNVADYADHLGINSGADSCCRHHDHCPFAIEGFSSRFNTFNYRPHTLSHCDCDEQFKKCLKQADSNAAAVVGRVYFNMVNTQCFDLKMEKVCTRRSWWGTCEKYSTQWVAHVRSLGYF